MGEEVQRDSSSRGSHDHLCGDVGPVAHAAGEREFFTLVFAGDLRKVPHNPHTTDTPFGRAVVAGLGNAFADFDRFVEQRDALLEALRATRADLVILRGSIADAEKTQPRWAGMTDEVRHWIARIDQAIQLATGGEDA